MIEFGKKDNFLALIEDYIKYYRGYSIVEITGISEEGNLLHINCATKFKKEKDLLGRINRYRISKFVRIYL